MLELEYTDLTGARAGKLNSHDKQIETPVFMPVATRATLRTLDSRDLSEIKAEMIIANAFLLSLKPGNRVLQDFGGIRAFMNWEGSLFTDSGGFQMIRKGFLLKINDTGLVLRSPYDGKKIEVTPEDVVDWMAAQRPDVGMVLDDLPPFGAGEERNRESVARTIAWAKRSIARYDELDLGSQGISLFTILQGGIDPDLRRKCIERMVEMDPQGFGIGGLSIGESRESMMSMVELTTSKVPEEKPVYLMGVGSPLELLDCIALGVDIFDSVFPARHARHRTVITGNGNYSIWSATHAGNPSPLEDGCQCPTCSMYSRGYIHHQARTGEFGWMRLVSIHNLFFTQDLMRRAREAIVENRFNEFMVEFRDAYENSI